MTSEPTAPSDGHGDVLAELTAVLADVVHADPDRVDPEQQFAVFGLDSLLSVEFVSAVTQRFESASPARTSTSTPRRPCSPAT